MAAAGRTHQSKIPPLTTPTCPATEEARFSHTITLDHHYDFDSGHAVRRHISTLRRATGGTT
jgi:hypothetical protein